MRWPSLCLYKTTMPRTLTENVHFLHVRVCTLQFQSHVGSSAFYVSYSLHFGISLFLSKVPDTSDTDTKAVSSNWELVWNQVTIQWMTRREIDAKCQDRCFFSDSLYYLKNVKFRKLENLGERWRWRDGNQEKTKNGKRVEEKSIKEGNGEEEGANRERGGKEEKEKKEGERSRVKGQQWKEKSERVREEGI